DTATTEISTLSLPGPLPISHLDGRLVHRRLDGEGLLRIADAARRSGVGDVRVNAVLHRGGGGRLVHMRGLVAQTPEPRVIRTLIDVRLHVERMQRHVFLDAEPDVNLR